MKDDFLIYRIGKIHIRSRRLSNGEIVLLRTSCPLKVYELFTVNFDIRKEWAYNENNYASGDILDYRLVENNIGIDGLNLQIEKLWDPVEEYGEEAEEYCPGYIKEGLRHSYVFEDYSGFEFYGPDTDPISDAVEAMEAGYDKKAYQILTRLLEEYPECIDALAHLGSMSFENGHQLDHARHCYKAAVSLAEKKFPKGFDGVILWNRVKNRPYLRALNGYCMVNWRLKEFSEAYDTAKKILRLNPPDNQGIRFCIDKIKNREDWEE